MKGVLGLLSVMVFGFGLWAGIFTAVSWLGPPHWTMPGWVAFGLLGAAVALRDVID